VHPALRTHPQALQQMEMQTPLPLLCKRFCDVRCNLVHPALRTHPQALQQMEMQTPPVAAMHAFL